jgi:hypothetical protein
MLTRSASGVAMRASSDGSTASAVSATRAAAALSVESSRGTYTSKCTVLWASTPSRSRLQAGPRS